MLLRQWSARAVIAVVMSVGVPCLAAASTSAAPGSASIELAGLPPGAEPSSVLVYGRAPGEQPKTYTARRTAPHRYVVPRLPAGRYKAGSGAFRLLRSTAGARQGDVFVPRGAGFFVARFTVRSGKRAVARLRYRRERAPQATRGATSVSVGGAGDNFVCAAIAQAARCWGAFTPGSTPRTYVDGGVTQVSSGSYHACAVAAGAVHCWASRQAGFPVDPGILGGPRNAQGVATPIASGALAVSAGLGATCALLQGGAVSCWGDNVYGVVRPEASDDEVFSRPVTVVESGATAIDAASAVMCALMTDTSVRCQGSWDGADGELSRPLTTVIGGGAARFADTPPAVVGGTCVLMSDGRRGCLDEAARPRFVARGGFQQLALSSSGSECGLVADALRCTGSRAFGQLGDGRTRGRVRSFVTVIGRGATQVSLGSSMGCAIVDTAVKCWGQNDSQELGSDPHRTLSAFPIFAPRR